MWWALRWLQAAEMNQLVQHDLMKKSNQDVVAVYIFKKRSVKTINLTKAIVLPIIFYYTYNFYDQS